MARPPSWLLLPRCCGRWSCSAAGRRACGPPRSSCWPSQAGIRMRPCSAAPSPSCRLCIGCGPACGSGRSTGGAPGGTPCWPDSPRALTASPGAWPGTWRTPPKRGEAVAGAAADLTKCYDGVRHPLLRRALAAAGWPPSITGPLLPAYSAPRRLRVGDAIGRCATPMAGVPAGCPLAVAVLAALAWPWQLAVEAAGATKARRYVDGLTAWARGPPRQVPSVAAATWAATAGFVAAAQLQLSEPTSCVFAGTVSGRWWLQRRCPEAQLLRSFQDLGVEQHAGMHGCAVLAGRVMGTRGAV